MLFISIWFIVAIAIIIIGFIYIAFTYERRYNIDNYFVKIAVKGNPKFTHVSIKPYYGEGYYLNYHCGRDVYTVRDIHIPKIYGAELENIINDVCFTLGIPRGSMQNEIQAKNTIIVKLKPGVTL